MNETRACPAHKPFDLCTHCVDGVFVNGENPAGTVIVQRYTASQKTPDIETVPREGFVRLVLIVSYYYVHGLESTSHYPITQLLASGKCMGVTSTKRLDGRCAICSGIDGVALRTYLPYSLYASVCNGCFVHCNDLSTV